MTINKVRWPGLLAILSFAALSVFGLQSSFNAQAGSLAPASAFKKRYPEDAVVIPDVGQDQPAPNCVLV